MLKILVFSILIAISCTNKNGIVQDPVGMRPLVYDPFVFDSDGDTMVDQKEWDTGRHPFIADLPQIDIRFLQNYSISINYLEDGKEKEFNIDTKTFRGQADFKYRVGDIFIRHASFKQAAKIGVHATHHHMGEITDDDLNFVKYPSVDKRFHLNIMNDFKEKINRKDFIVQNITIVLENSVQLAENTIYNSIKDLQLDFYFFDHETRSHVNIGSKKIERHFSAGVDETFEVILENVPFKFIRDGYFSHGEFVISEVKNYEIPDLKTTYKQLMSGVKKKTIPVIYNTPLESRIFYVSLGEKKKKSFHDIFKTIFDTQFAIEEDALIKIRQFGNNLQTYTYLHELRDKSKQGKWFVFTSPLNRHYLDYQFSNEDKISVSYVTGHILARQAEQSIHTYDFQFTPGEYEHSMPLGDSSANAEINLLISPVLHWGQEVQKEDIFYDEGKRMSCGGGNVCPGLDFACKIHRYEFPAFEKPLDLKKSLGGDISKMLFLVIGENEYALEDLQKEKKLRIHWMGNDAHIVIKDIQKIQELSVGEENPIALKIKTKVQKSSQGLRLIEASRSGKIFCADIIRKISMHRGNIPLSEESLLMDLIKVNASQHGLDLVKQREYRQYFLFKINAILDNFHN